MFEFNIDSINLSLSKGTKKSPVEKVEFDKELGLVGDADSGSSNYKISLLDREAVEIYDTNLQQGDLQENITTSKFVLNRVRILDYIKIGTALLQVYSVGKSKRNLGEEENLFNERAVFLKVIKNGQYKKGDKGYYIPKSYKVAVIVLSDRASKNNSLDTSGEIILEELNAYFESISRKAEINKLILADSKTRISFALEKYLRADYDLIITTGGTGIGSRDNTIEVAKSFVRKEIPGIMEYVRMKYGQENKFALISRSFAGVNDKSLIFCLPGSAKAVKEYLEEIMPLLSHLYQMMYDLDTH